MAGAADVSAPVLVASTLPELLDEPSAMRLLEAGIAPVAGLSTALVCAGALGAKPGSLQRLMEIAAAARRANSPWKPPRNPPEVRQPGRWLAEHEAKSLLRAKDIPVLAGLLSTPQTRRPRPRVAWLSRRTAVGPGLLHKTEPGALALDLTDEDSVLAAFACLRRLPGHSSTASSSGMAEPGIEILQPPGGRSRPNRRGRARWNLGGGSQRRRGGAALLAPARSSRRWLTSPGRGCPRRPRRPRHRHCCRRPHRRPGCGLLSIETSI
jgi:hypothetical protein